MQTRLLQNLKNVLQQPLHYSVELFFKIIFIQFVKVIRRLGTGIGGKSFVVLTGEVAAVQSAVDAGTHTPTAAGMLVESVVIPSPHPDLLETLL